MNHKNPYGLPPVGTDLLGKLPVFLKIAPFFLSAVLFHSAFFIFLTPFPLLMMRFFRGVPHFWFFCAVLSNSLLMILFSRDLLSVGTFFLMISFSWIIPFFMEKLKPRIDLVLTFSFFTVLVFVVLFIIGVSVYKNTTPLLFLEGQIEKSSTQVIEVLKAIDQKEIPEIKDLKKQVFEQGVFIFFAFFIFTAWGNMLLVFRSPVLGLFQRFNVPQDYFRKWKVTDHLIWLLIISGAGAVFFKDTWGIVSLNALKIILIPYALQGLAIIAFFFNLWKIEGFFRVILLIVIIGFISPLILMLGVFDLWFDFRVKFGQIKKT